MLKQFHVTEDACKLSFGMKGILDTSKTVLDYGITNGMTLNLIRGGLSGGVHNKAKNSATKTAVACTR